MIGRITWVDYTVDSDLGTLVRYRCRMKDGSSRSGYIVGTSPYLFVPEEEALPNEGFITEVKTGYESLFDQDLKRLSTETPKQVGKLTEEFSWTGEADVPYYRRVSIHDGLSGYVDLPEETSRYEGQELIHIDNINTEVEYDGLIEPRISIADIEVAVGDESFDDMVENASSPINVITSYDTYNEDYSVFFYDKHNSITDRSKIREYASENWPFENMDSVDIQMYESESESLMLNSFIQYCNERSFDLISGWNLPDFDYKYIQNRIKELDGISLRSLYQFNDYVRSRNSQMRIPGFPAFDMMKAFCDKMTFSNWRSQSLDYVSNEELGVGKIDDVDITGEWETNPERLIGYNLIDVALTVALDESNDIHNFFYDLASDSSIPIYDTFYEKRLVDGYVMSRRGNDEVLPTADESDSIDNPGGYVANAVQGRFEKVGVSDLKSLYPSGMITWNISTETISETPDNFDNYVKVPRVPAPKNVHGKIEESQINWDWLYCSLDEQGIIPRTLKNLFKKRDREKSLMYEAEEGSLEESKWERKQGATKVIMNSFYGNASSPYWRLSNQYLGSAITSVARYTLWKGEQTVERLGYNHLYSDTDSHFIQLESDTVEEQVQELKDISHEMDNDASDIAKDIGIEDKHPYLVEDDLHGDDYTCLVWEPEKTYFLWMQLDKKKRYAGNISWKEGTFYQDGKISISGFENQRSDSMEVTAELQKKVIDMILTGSEFDEVSEYIQNIINEISASSEDVKRFALPGSINKPLEDYPNRQIPRASEYSNKHLGYEFGEGDDPFVYLVNSTPPDVPNTDVVAFKWNEEVYDGFELDKEAIIERGIKKPIDSIISEMGWDFSELRSGREQQTFELGDDSSGNPFQ